MHLIKEVFIVQKIPAALNLSIINIVNPEMIYLKIIDALLITNNCGFDVLVYAITYPTLFLLIFIKDFPQSFFKIF